jgi:hypothetical protein
MAEESNKVAAGTLVGGFVGGLLGGLPGAVVGALVVGGANAKRLDRKAEQREQARR